MKSTYALILTILCALTAHVSTYLNPGIIKYLATGVGSFSAIISGILLFQLRKPFIREFSRSDWGHEGDPNKLLIRKSEHKKESPNIIFESFDTTTSNWSPAVVDVTIQNNRDVLISVGNVNSNGLQKVRVTIK